MCFTKSIKIHINQHECSHKSTFCCDGSNHGGEEEWRDDVCDYVMRIDIPGNTFFCMANQVISCHLGLTEDGD